MITSDDYYETAEEHALEAHLFFLKRWGKKERGNGKHRRI